MSRKTHTVSLLYDNFGKVDQIS